MKISFIILGLLFLAATGFGQKDLSFHSAADHWDALPYIAKQTYINGFRDATVITFHEAARQWLSTEERERAIPSDRMEAVRKDVFTFCDMKDLIEMMDQLYHDRENEMIEFSDMIYLARDKVLGRDIEPNLVTARVKAEEDFHYRTHSEFKILGESNKQEQ